MNPLITHCSLKSWDTDIMWLQILHRLRPWHHHETVLLRQLNSNLTKSSVTWKWEKSPRVTSPRTDLHSIPELVPRSQQQCHGNEGRHLSWSCRQHHLRAQPWDHCSHYCCRPRQSGVQMVPSGNPVTREAGKFVPGILNCTWEETGSAFKDRHFEERKIQEDKKNASVLRTQLANCLLCEHEESSSHPR